ncbi:unnamed protein product [Toxocara canis]|uniref:PDZ domain-containing protein n=1 Tax=Toxocara canis TaxID=6265 RepID=A0A183U3I8_TOXCA|nr:unnamed protein product [Toxocara canis]
MVEHDLISWNSTDDISKGRLQSQARGTVHTYRFRLEPDTSVYGSLAFRLVGNRSHGVFVCGISERSEQSKLLKNGDQILEVSGIDVRRFACDQVANILRLSMLRDGCAFLKVCQDKQVQLLLRTRSNIVGNPSSAESCSLKRSYSSHYTEPPTHLRTSTSDFTGFGDPHCEIAVWAFKVVC